MTYGGCNHFKVNMITNVNCRLSCFSILGLAAIKGFKVMI